MGNDAASKLTQQTAAAGVIFQGRASPCACVLPRQRRIERNPGLDKTRSPFVRPSVVVVLVQLCSTASCFALQIHRALAIWVSADLLISEGLWRRFQLLFARSLLLPLLLSPVLRVSRARPGPKAHSPSGPAILLPPPRRHPLLRLLAVAPFDSQLVSWMPTLRMNLDMVPPRNRTDLLPLRAPLSLSHCSLSLYLHRQ